MKQKTILVLAVILTMATLVSYVFASWSINEGVDGYVYRCGMPTEGIIVQVYDSSGSLVGFGVNDDGSQGMSGTDVTNASGYFHIAWLEGAYADYMVIAKTPAGDIIGTAEVMNLGCGETRRICFNYCPSAEPLTIGYWKNHPEAWPVTTLKIGDQTYNQNELLVMLQNAKAKDATYMLAAQLIAAKLNVANGVDSTSIYGTIEDADEFLTAHPIGSNPTGAYRNYALELKDALDQFNNGY